ncbi:hypothetical protein [Burkholderia multivorans]|uniref:hypothetical protein n=1 Tax=Burkholderia TaxID=32008 RepID=UPI001C23D7A4|nr:hypothetical protein [Burkholderia multivorans]MBU9492844.1 hypothetical protein [Burkholderia multivorans]MBU9544396.1 hypothetical protein [Burkholderia multivorans]MCA8174807.1 hypothetical protein [Burkholderia multivorans]MCA8223090.1 hypothetical protein [Burkholderia multivorans]
MSEPNQMTQQLPGGALRKFFRHTLVTAVVGALIGCVGTWIVDRNMVSVARETARLAEQRAAFAEVWGQAELFALKQARYDQFSALDALAAKMPQNPVSAIFRDNYRTLGAAANHAHTEARDALAAKRLLLSEQQYDTTRRFIDVASAATRSGSRTIGASDTAAGLEALRSTAKALLAAD